MSELPITQRLGKRKPFDGATPQAR